MGEQLSWIHAIVLGVVQGLTEFLPISSTAHTLIVSRLMGWGDPGAAFTAVTQVGTESAVLWYFRRDIGRIVRAWGTSVFQPSRRRDPHALMGWYIILGSLPIGILGVAFKNHIENEARNLWVVAIALVVVGLVIGVVDRTARHVKGEESVTPRSALLLGLGQAMALVPGVSRSGATIATGLALGFTREAAARYSFLLAVPAVLASAALEAADIGGDTSANWPATLVATAIAGIVGYAVIARLMEWLRTRSFVPFVVYRVVLGTGLMVALASGELTAR